MKTIVFLMLLIAGLILSPAEAQINIKGKVKDKSAQRANDKTGDGIDKGLNKVEEGVGNLFNKKKQTEEEIEVEEAETENEVDETEKIEPKAQKQKLETYTQYDFVPGDKILLFEDFSQDNVGDFPDLWATTGSGEIKTVNIAPGKWFHMNGADAFYCFTKAIEFPSNFIMEFDIIPDEEYYEGYEMTFYEDPENKELDNDFYPGAKGLHIILKADAWETKGYNNVSNGDWLNGYSETNPVVKEEVNHVIIWIQNRRVRIYHQGRKTLDMPTNIYAGTKFNRFRFSGWDRNAFPLITNLKITTASPDTRSKILTEGKLISYGIYFDPGKDVVKPESYGAIKDIANVLNENQDLRINIIGHTDSDGDEAKNLDLSNRRAQNVKTYLVNEFKIDESRIDTDGKGESEPVESNTSVEGKAKNRRVEFVKL